jgi:hypothetical protein
MCSTAHLLRWCLSVCVYVLLLYLALLLWSISAFVVWLFACCLAWWISSCSLMNSEQKPSCEHRSMIKCVVCLCVFCHVYDCAASGSLLLWKLVADSGFAQPAVVNRCCMCVKMMMCACSLVWLWASGSMLLVSDVVHMCWVGRCCSTAFYSLNKAGGHSIWALPVASSFVCACVTQQHKGASLKIHVCSLVCLFIRSPSQANISWNLAHTIVSWDYSKETCLQWEWNGYDATSKQNAIDNNRVTGTATAHT